MSSSAGGHGSFQHMRPTMMSSPSSLFGMVHRSRSPNTRASSSSTLSNQAVVASKSNANNHSANNNSNSANNAGSVLPPLKNGLTSSSSSPPTQQYLPRSRLGSNDSHASDTHASVSPIFGNSPIVRQGKHYAGHQSNGDNHNNTNNNNNNNNNKVGNNNSAPNSLTGTPVVTKNKRTPPIFAVPFKNPQQQQSQPAQPSSQTVTRERFGSCDSCTSDS